MAPNRFKKFQKKLAAKEADKKQNEEKKQTETPEECNFGELRETDPFYWDEQMWLQPIEGAETVTQDVKLQDELKQVESAIENLTLATGDQNTKTHDDVTVPSIFDIESPIKTATETLPDLSQTDSLVPSVFDNNTSPNNKHLPTTNLAIADSKVASIFDIDDEPATTEKEPETAQMSADASIFDPFHWETPHTSEAKVNNSDDHVASIRELICMTENIGVAQEMSHWERSPLLIPVQPIVAEDEQPAPDSKPVITQDNDDGSATPLAMEAHHDKSSSDADDAISLFLDGEAWVNQLLEVDENEEVVSTTDSGRGSPEDPDVIGIEVEDWSEHCARVTQMEDDDTIPPLTKEQEDFMLELERDFADRYTDRDTAYWMEDITPLPEPPVIANWETKNVRVRSPIHKDKPTARKSSPSGPNGFEKNIKKANHTRQPDARNNNHRRNNVSVTQGHSCTLKMIRGDVLTSRHPVAHCISANAAMSMGVARDICDVIDSMAPAGHLSERGRVASINAPVGSVVPGGNVSRKFIHMITKRMHYDKPTLGSLKLALSNLELFALENGVHTIAMPLIAMGLDRVRPSDVLQCINESVSKICIHMYYLNFNPFHKEQFHLGHYHGGVIPDSPAFSGQPTAPMKTIRVHDGKHRVTRGRNSKDSRGCAKQLFSQH